MDIREFLDKLYSLWAKTTGAENQYWMPEDSYIHGQDIWAVNEEQAKSPVASFMSDADASFVTAIHGALPDLVRRTHEALDEADRLDEQRDEQEIRIAGLEETIDEKNRAIEHFEAEQKGLLAALRDLEDQVDQLNGELDWERENGSDWDENEW